MSATAAVVQQNMLMRIWRVISDLLILTKYRITMVALFTGYTAIVVQGDHATDWAFVWPCLLALFALGGAANTLNQLFELKKDAVMNRTKARRHASRSHYSSASQSFRDYSIRLCRSCFPRLLSELARGTAYRVDGAVLFLVLHALSQAEALPQHRHRRSSRSDGATDRLGSSHRDH